MTILRKKREKCGIREEARSIIGFKTSNFSRKREVIYTREMQEKQGVIVRRKGYDGGGTAKKNVSKTVLDCEGTFWKIKGTNRAIRKEKRRASTEIVG